MKEINWKKDKAISTVIVSILMIAIGIVIGATLVTVVGGIAHGGSNNVISMSATTQEVSNYNNGYVVFLNVTSSSAAINTNQVLIVINGTNDGTFSIFLNSTSDKVPGSAKEPLYIAKGSEFSFSKSQKATSLELIYKENVIYENENISIASHGVSNSVFSMGATTQETGPSSSSTGGIYYVYLNVTSTSRTLNASYVTICVNNISQGSLSSPGNLIKANSSNSGYLEGGSDFVFTAQKGSSVDEVSNGVTSLKLAYGGNVIFNSGSISIIARGGSNSVVTVGATTQEINNTSSYTVYFNVSSSSISVSTSNLTVLINGISEGTFSNFLTIHKVNLTSTSVYKNLTTLSGGSSFEFSNTHQVTSFELVYDGNTIYQSGAIRLN